MVVLVRSVVMLAQRQVMAAQALHRLLLDRLLLTLAAVVAVGFRLMAPALVQMVAGMAARLVVTEPAQTEPQIEVAVVAAVATVRQTQAVTVAAALYLFAIQIVTTQQHQQPALLPLRYLAGIEFTHGLAAVRLLFESRIWRILQK